MWGDLKVVDSPRLGTQSWELPLGQEDGKAAWTRERGMSGGWIPHWPLQARPRVPRDPQTPPGRGQGTPRPARGCSPLERLPRLCQDPPPWGTSLGGAEGVPHIFGGASCVVGGLGRQRLGGVREVPHQGTRGCSDLGVLGAPVDGGAGGPQDPKWRGLCPPPITTTSSPCLSPPAAPPLRFWGALRVRGVGASWGPPNPARSHGNAGCEGSRPLAADDVTSRAGHPHPKKKRVGEGSSAPRGPSPPVGAPPRPTRHRPGGSGGGGGGRGCARRRRGGRCVGLGARVGG